MQDMSDLRAKRRARLVRTAERVFISQGYRGATMEGIAESASVSKATLYSYFPDKSAIFDAVAEAVAHDLVGIVEAKLDGIADPVAAVIAALAAKHGHVHSLVRSSPFAEELFRTKDTVSARHFQRADARICQSLVRRLSEVRDDGQECAALVLAASQGIANATQSKTQLHTRIARLHLLLDPANGSVS